MARNFIKNALQGLNTAKPKVSTAPRRMTYESNDLEIPDAFLRGPSETPVVLTPIQFASSAVPEYDGCFAVTIDNVLSPEECKKLTSLAEQSVPSAPDDSTQQSPWRPAMVSLGPGVEAPAPGYRESDRIIWDQQEIVDRVWERCCQAKGLQDKLAVVEDRGVVRGRLPGKWVLSRVNERMRFLKYSPGQYFKPHCDGAYWYEADGKEFQTHYTLHLYLNDSSTVSSESNLWGGATAFLSRDRKRSLDVNPRAGSVLIFQHEKLFHEGAKVTQGEKFTVRTDILYEWVNNKKKEEEEEEKEVAAE